jgi:hypothetical protein
MHIDKNLYAADERIRDRAGIAAAFGDSAVQITDDNMAFMFVGTGLFCLEPMSLANKSALKAVGAMLSADMSIMSALESQYIEGFLVALEFAKLQQGDDK